MAALFKRSTSFLTSFSRLSVASASPCAAPLASTSTLFSPSALLQVRHKSLVPRRTKYRKAHKGRIPIATGGSTKGTTLEWGDYGLRVNEPVRLSAKHLETAEAALKRGLKPIRGSKVYVLTCCGPSLGIGTTRRALLLILAPCPFPFAATSESSPTSQSASRWVL